jgi:hypothetical protein
MVKLKSLLKEWNDTSFKSLPKRWSKNVNDTRDGLTELESNMDEYGKITNPVHQKYNFDKPTVVHISKQDMETLHNDGTLETNGLTLIYEK